MATIILNKWDGGMAEDIRTHATDQCEQSLNFDIFTNPHKLIPYGDSVAETLASGSMSDIQISDVNVSLIGSTYYITGSGNESSISVKPAFYTKSSLVSAFTQQAVGAGNAYVNNSGVVYKDKFYALAYNSGAGQYTLYRYDSAGSVTNCGTITASHTTPAKPFVHPEDNKLYIVIGNVISYYNGTDDIGTSVGTSYSVSTILPSTMYATSITDYGSYLAIAMSQLNGVGNSYVYLWGRDATINTLQGVLNFGGGIISVLENLDNNLIAVIRSTSSFDAGNDRKIIIRGYFGGSIEDMKSINVASTDYITIYKAKYNNKLYFGNTNADDCIYCFGKNKSGNYILTKDRYLFNGVTTYGGLVGLSFIGDVMWALSVVTIGAYSLMRSKINVGETKTYASTSVYKTTINPSMPIEHRGKNKQLKAVRVYFTGKASGTIGVKYSVDGSAMASVISESTTAIEDMKQATMIADGSAFQAGRELQFQIESTGGCEVKSLEYEYEILNQ